MKKRVLAMVMVVMLLMVSIPFSASADTPRASVTKRALVVSAPYDNAINSTDFNGMQNLFKRYMSSSNVKHQLQTSSTTLPYLYSRFQDAFDNANANDINYVYISAHGMVEENQNIMQFCLSINGKNNSTRLPMTVLRDWLDDFNGHFVLMIDSCHSGDAIGRGESEDNKREEDMLTSKQMAQKILDDFLFCDENPTRSGEFANCSKYTVFCSSRSTQTSWTGFPLYSLATYAWAAGAGYDILLNQNWNPPAADVNSDSIVTVLELYALSLNSVNNLTALYGYDEQTVCVYSASPYYSAFYFGDNPLGDVSLDKIVTMADVLKLNQFISGVITFSDRQMQLADMNGDGNVTMVDVLKMRQHIAAMS